MWHNIHQHSFTICCFPLYLVVFLSVAIKLVRNQSAMWEDVLTTCSKTKLKPFSSVIISNMAKGTIDYDSLLFNLEIIHNCRDSLYIWCLFALFHILLWFYEPIYIKKEKIWIMLCAFWNSNMLKKTREHSQAIEELKNHVWCGDSNMQCQSIHIYLDFITHT